MIWDMLEELTEAQGGKEKQKVLKRILSDELGERFIRYAYNDTVYQLSDTSLASAFGVEMGSDVTLTLMENIHGEDETFTELSPQHHSGHDKLAYLQFELRRKSPLAAKWHARALLHDLRCGVQLKTVNKVLREMQKPIIFVFEVELCDKIEINDVDTLKFPLIVEEKYDGIRAVITITDGVPLVMSRHGNELTHLFPEIVKELSENLPKGKFMFDGEITSTDFQTLARRVQRNEPTNDIPLLYNVFDILWFETLELVEKPLLERKHFLLPALNNMKLSQLAPYKHVHTAQEVLDFYHPIIARQGEGIIIKKLDCTYEPGGRNNWIKLKPVHSADLRCVGAEYGYGKKVSVIASLQLEDASGKVKCSVGSGIDDQSGLDLTEMFVEGKLIGRIVEILYSELTKTGSIRFPRFVAVRTDKTEPDTLG